MEGPTRVLKQLRALWHILELLDKEMFAHLSKIGAESLHFAFRMLLVLFRRELSFNEALSMWEVCDSFPPTIFKKEPINSIATFLGNYFFSCLLLLQQKV